LPRAPLLAVAALLGGVLLAGCGGGSGSPTAATAGSATNTATTASSASRASTTGSSSATGEGASSSGSTAPSPLAFARCMRADGVPNFPDPQSGGGTIFSTAGINPSAPAFKAAQAKCQKLLPHGGAGPAFSEQSLVEVRKVAVCMRAHGISEFPDPKRASTGRLPSVPAGIAVITDYDGALLEFPATLNMQSPAYKQAARACGALAQKLGRPH
jgi:hypothetical protein